MKHIVALILKYVMVTLAITIAFILFKDRFTFTQILIIAAGVTLLAYVIGDLLILPATNNTIATVADFGLAFLTVWAFNYFLPITISLFDALASAMLIGLGEWIFHKYMAGRVFVR